MVKPFVSEEVLLDPEMRSPEVLDFERRLLSKRSSDKTEQFAG